MPAYSAEDFTVVTSAGDYIGRFRDAERFAPLCRECGNYGRSWGCPPFECDIVGRLRSYSRLLLVATKIMPRESGLPIGESRRLILPERIRLEARLRELEKEFDGLSCSYSCSCLHCPESQCTRPDGNPCRHPDLVRPSLEGLGFDMGRTVSELFGFGMVWGENGKIPEYLTIVCGLFFNSERTPVL